MSGRIGLSIEEFNALKNKLRGLKDQVNTEMTSIGATAEQMESAWQGQASQAFRSKITDWKTKNMSDFNQIMEEALQKLDSYVQQMQQIDNNSF